MTINEYYEKYKERTKTDVLKGSMEIVDDIWLDFVTEFVNLNQTGDSNCERIIANNLNRKWNKLRLIFMQELGFTIMAKDGFLKRYKENQK